MLRSSLLAAYPALPGSADENSRGTIPNIHISTYMAQEHIYTDVVIHTYRCTETYVHGQRHRDIYTYT